MNESEKIVAKGKRAESLMDDPVLKEALESIKVKQTEVIVSSALSARDVREEAYLLLKAVEALELALGKIRADGQFEEYRAKRR